MNKERIMETILKELASRKIDILDQQSLQLVAEQLLMDSPNMMLIKILAKNIVNSQYYIQFVNYLLEVKKNIVDLRKEEELIVIEIIDDAEQSMQEVNKHRTKKEEQQIYSAELSKSQKEATVVPEKNLIKNLLQQDKSLREQHTHQTNVNEQTHQNEKWEILTDLFDPYGQQNQKQKDLEVILVIISNQQVSSIDLINPDNTISDICLQNSAKQQKYFFLRINRYFNFIYSNLSQHKLKIILKGTFVFNDEKILDPLNKFIKWQNKKGIILCNFMKQKSKDDENHALIMSSFYFCHHPKYQTWSVLSPWWYLIKTIYLSQYLPSSVEQLQQDLQGIFKIKYQFRKQERKRYAVWLLWSIFQQQLWTVTKKLMLPTWLRLNALQDYKYIAQPQKMMSFLELIYLRTLYYGQSAHKKILLQLNLQHQDLIVQRDMILEAEDKEFEQFHDIFEQAMLTNQNIAIISFLKKYLKFQTKYLIQQCPKGKSKQTKQLYFSEEILKTIKVIQQKCEKIAQSYPNLYVNLTKQKLVRQILQNLLFDFTGIKQIRLSSQAIVQYMSISKNIYQTQPYISRWLIQSLSLNEFTFKIILKDYFQQLFFLQFQPPIFEQQLNFIKKIIKGNRTLLVDLFKNTNEDEKILTILTFARQLDQDSTIFFRKQLQKELMNKFHKKQSLIQACLLLEISPSHYIQQRQSYAADNVNLPGNDSHVIKLEEPQNIARQVCQVFVIVISQYKYRNIQTFLNESQPRFEMIPLNQHEYLHFIFIRNVEKTSFTKKVRTLTGERSRQLLPTKAIINDKYGILLQDQGHGIDRQILALFKALEFISKEKLMEPNIQVWSNLIRTIFQHTKTSLIKSVSKHIKLLPRNNKISMKFIIALLIVLDGIYDEHQVLKFIEEDQIWQGIQYDISGYLQYSRSSQQQKINLLVCIRIFRAFMDNCISITIHNVAKTFKANIQRQTFPIIRKQLVLYMWKSQYRKRIQVINLFTMLKTQLTKQFLSNNLISNIEFLKIKLTYLKGLFERQNDQQCQQQQLLIFLDELKMKCQENNEKADQTGIEINNEEMRAIFFTREYRNQILQSLSPSSSNHSQRQTFIFSVKFLDFYTKMKSIKDKRIFNFFFERLEQPIRKKLSQNVKSNFKETISVLTRFTMQNFEKNLLEKFMQSQRLDIIHLVSLIEIYFEKASVQKDYIKNMIDIFIASYPDINLARNNFLDSINRLSHELKQSQQPNLLAIVNKMLQKNQIKENNFIDYFQSLKKITASQMKQIYSRKICQSFYHTHQLNPKKQDVFFSYLHKIQADKELLINTYYQYDKPAQNESQMLQQMLHAILQNPINISFLRFKYRKAFEKLVKRFHEFLLHREYTSIQINQMYKNRLDISKYLCLSEQKDFKQQRTNLLNLIEKEYEICCNANQQLDDLENVLSSIDQLTSQCKRIKQLRNSLIDGTRLKDIYPIIDKYKGLSQISHQVKVFQKLSCWKAEEINSYQSLKEHHQQCKIYLIQKAKNICQNSFNSFKENFLVLKQHQIELVFVQHRNLFDNMTYFLRLFEKDNFRKTVSAFQSYFYIHSILRGNFHEHELVKDQCLSVFSKITNSQDIQFKKALVSTQSAVNFLDHENFDANQKPISFIITVYQCRQLFQMMDSAKINEQMLQKFISFSNDAKNYIVTPQIAHSFKIIFVCWERLKQCKNLKQALKTIDQFNKEQTLDKLIRNIQNLFLERNLIFQKFQQANGPTTFFINQIRYLLTESTFKIEYNGKLEIIIDYFDQDIQKITRLNFQKLTNFKQKSLLQVYNDNDQQDQKKILILQNYRSLYSEIQSIRQNFMILISYGYDQNHVTCILKIQKDDFSAVSQKNKELARVKQEWIAKIKQIYSQSYFLTHFVGKKLAELSKIIFSKNRIQYSSIQNILGISEQRFFQIIDSQQTKSLLACAEDYSSIDKIRVIANIFNQDQMEIEQVNFNNKIVVISTALEMFNCYILKENNQILPKATQVFYCHQRSFYQQLEFFLYRAMIKYQQPHFIIGVHRLTQATKNSFCRTLHELKKSRPIDFARFRLIFIDNQDTNSVYQQLCKPKQFDVEKKLNQKALSKEQMQHFKQILAKQIKNITLITSAKAGLGKTYFTEKQAKARSLQVIHFPVCGTINMSVLGKRLKQFKLKGKQILLIKIGHVINKDLLSIFLESIILFRCIFSEEYIFIPLETIIHIQLENIYLPESKHKFYIPEEYHILQFLAASGKQVRIREFTPDNIDFPFLPNQHLYVYTILNLLNEQGNITQTNIKFADFHKQAAPIKEKCIYLLREYLMKRGMSSFILYVNLMKVLFFLFETFSNNQILHPIHISKWSPTYRTEFLRMCIDNACSLLEEMYTENTFKERNENLRNFQQISNSVSMLIMPVYAKDAYRFAYFKADNLPMQLKTFNYYQDINMRKQNAFEFPSPQRINQIFKNNSLQKLQGEKQQRQMLDILESVANSSQQIKTDELEKSRLLQNYKLTLDNFFKMCLLIQRERCGIPGILEGQSGVGKTALMKFLSKAIYQNILITENIHAGVDEEDLKKKMEDIKTLAKYYQGGNKKIWVFFDEFNTTDYLSYIKQIIIQHRFMGQKLLDNIQFFAACNPYRKIKPRVSSIMRVEGGLKKRKRGEIAFLVNFPPLSMVQLMYDYRQLTKKQNESYMEKMLKSLDCSANLKRLLVQTMCQLHEWITQNFDRSTVSLRDVERAKKLFIWFSEYFNKIIKTKLSKEDIQKKAAALTLLFCYGLRFSQQSIRLSIDEIIEKNMAWKGNYCQKVFVEEQQRLITSLQDKISQRRQVVINQAIKENIFTTFVCIMNKIPILIIGNPGSSKSLAIKIISSSFQGHRSSNQICKKFPRINMIYFQGSESCTSEGVEEVFNKAEETISKDFLNCIYFDEIGLAENSVHNPLKVLHNKLQLHEDCKYSFVGVSNYEVDASKMSRFLVLNRSLPSEKDLKATARLIYNKIVTFRNTRKDSSMQEIQNLGTYYSKFIQWLSNNQQEQSGFFGLRDYYNYVKYVCQNLEKDRHLRNLEKYIVEAIQVNFDGKEDSILNFISRLPNENIDFGCKPIKPLKMIEQNLKDPSSRCLMEIVESDSLVPYVFSKIDYRKCVIYYGSAYSKDESSEEYSYEMTFKVMSHMSKGQVILFKDPNSSLQSSLYDLFNKSFVSYNGRNFCRIAVGASNSECFVHENFNAIVFVSSKKVRSLDFPFLNRFEKHFLRVEQLLTQESLAIKNVIKQWIELITAKENNRLHQQFLLINSGQDSINTLLIKYEDRPFEQAVKEIKKTLLKNRTTDFEIMLRYSSKDNVIIEEMKYLIQQISYEQRSTKDMIIFTYDQYVQLTGDQNSIIRQIQERPCYKVKVGAMESEKQLKGQLKYGLSQDLQMLIIVDYIQDKQYIEQVLYLAKQIKEELACQKQLIVIVCLHRCDIAVRKEPLVQISHLHQYQQYFFEDTNPNVDAIYKTGANYWTLYQLAQSQETNLLQILYIETLSTLNLRYQNKSKIERVDFFQQLRRLNEDSYYQNQIRLFIKETLSNSELSINYQLLHQNIQQYSNIYESVKSVISIIVKKLIKIFLRLIISKGYIKIFSPSLCEEEIKPILHLLKSCMKSDMDELKNQIAKLEFERLYQQKEEKQIIVNQQESCFNLFDFYTNIEKKTFDLKKSNNLVISQEQDQHFTYFSLALETNRQASKIPKEIFLTKEFSYCILKDLISFISDLPLQPCQLLALTNFFNNKIHLNEVQQKIYLLLYGNRQLWRYLNSILLILNKYSPQSLEKTPPINLMDIKRTERQVQIGRTILKFALNLCKLHDRTLLTFRVPDYLAYFKLIQEKVKSAEFQQFRFQAEEEFYLTNKFLLLLEKTKQDIPQEFFKQGHRSIYDKIYAFAKTQISNSEYRKFLSYNFFVSWITHIQKNENHEFENCVDEFSRICNEDSSFANRSAPFFSIIIGDFMSFQELEKALREGSINNHFKKHLHPQNFLSITLTNYFFSLIERYANRQKQGRQQSFIKGFYQRFERYLLEIRSVDSVSDLFKIAFIKRYLCFYVQELINLQYPQELKKVNQLIQQSRYFLKDDIYHFMFDQLKLNHQKQIIQQVIKKNRCHWILIAFNGTDPSSIRYRQLFKNIQYVLKDNQLTCQDSLFTLFLNTKRGQQFQAIDFKMKHIYCEGVFNYGTFLFYLSHVLRFIAKVKRLCSLKISKFEISNKRLIDLFEEQAKSQDELESLTTDFKLFLQICQKLNNQKNNRIISDFNLETLQVSIQSKVQDFVFLNDHESHNQGGQRLGRYVESLARAYNKISFELIKALRINSQEFGRKAKRIDPFSINKQTKLLHFISKEEFQGIIQRYSHYTISDQVSTVEFSLQEIQEKILQLTDHILLQQNLASFSSPQFIGSSQHFLVQMKMLKTNKTLKQVNKLADIEEYFKREKIAKGRNFSKYLKKIHNDLETVLVFMNNLQCKPTILLEDFVNTYLKHLSKQLQEEPFKNIPCSAMVDLYEFVEYLTFENLKDKLDQRYQRQGSQQDRQKFVSLLSQIRKQESSYPSEDQFKKALYRFVGRKVIKENVEPSQSLAAQLCIDRHYWDQSLRKQQWKRIGGEQFKIGLNIKLDQLGWVLRQLPYEKIDQILPSIKLPQMPKSNKKFW